jgi:hypothetical protein
MTIGTFAISALQEIRKIKGWENAVIAGGFVRDYLLGKDFKDVDIFVPCGNPWEFRKIFGETKKSQPFSVRKLSGTDISKSYLVSTDAFEKFFGDPKIENKEPPLLKIEGFSDFEFNEPLNSEYSPKSISHFIDMVNCKYMGNIDIDIMAINLPNNEDFGKGVVENFNFNIDKVYFNGVESVTTKEHQKDVDRGRATLCRLDSMEYLPRAMEKFKRLKDKYEYLVFDCSCLEIKGKETKTVKSRTIKSSKLDNIFGGAFGGAEARNVFEMLDRNEIP